MVDGTARRCYTSDDIVAPVGLDVSDGAHGLGVMKKADQGGSELWGVAFRVTSEFPHHRFFPSFGVERTLLSAAFDVAFDLEFDFA